MAVGAVHPQAVFAVHEGGHLVVFGGVAQGRRAMVVLNHLMQRCYTWTQVGTVPGGAAPRAGG